MTAIETAKVGTRLRPFIAKDASSFEAWLRRAKRGQWCAYWVGHLLADRELPHDVEVSHPLWVRAEAAQEIGRAAWRAYLASQATLAQARQIGGGYVYLAIKL